MSKSKETLYIYLRVSTSNQERDGTSLPEQENLGIAKAKSLGMEYEVHNEGANSGSLDDIEDRPVLANLLSMVESGHVRHIYCYNHDRLSRNDLTWSIIKKRFIDHKVTLHTHITTSRIDNPMDELILTFMTGLTKYENTIRTARLKNGRFIRAKQGYWVLGNLPFGYRMGKNKKLAIDKEQSEWVERIFKWYSEGLSPMRIKRKLDGNVQCNNSDSVIWTDGSVNSILRNSHHRGFYTYLGVNINCPKVVDDNTLKLVNKRLEQSKPRKRGNVGKNHNFPLTEIMSCGHCGTQIGGRTFRLKDGMKRIRYKCVCDNRKWKTSTNEGDWKRNKYCENNVSMESGPTEETIWTTLIEVLRLSHQEREIFKKSVLGVQKKLQKNRDSEIKKLKVQIENTKETISLIEERIEEKEVEKISSREKAKSIQSFIDKLHRELDKLSNELLGMENDLITLESDNLWIHWIQDYQDNMDKLLTLDPNHRIEVIRKYIKSIKVYFDSETRKHRLDLKFKLPLIGDGFKWKDSLKKKHGYRLSKGQHEKVLYLDSKQMRKTRSDKKSKEELIVV